MSLHDDRCASLKGYPCNCASAAMYEPPQGIVVHWDDQYMLKGAWCAHLDDYDGAEDAGWQPVGHGATKQAAVDDLNEQIEAHACTG